MGEPGRTRWTDERLDDLGLSVRDEVRALRAEMRELRAEMRDEFRQVRSEIADVRQEASLNRRWLVSLWATNTLGFVAVLIQVSLR